MGASITVDKEEVLRYLGGIGKDLDNNIDNLINDCIKEIKDISRFNYIYRRFSLLKENEKILLNKCNLIFYGKDIYTHLIHSNDCILVAATLGINVDRKINLYEKTDMTRAIILDATATTYIEKSLDLVQQDIREEIIKENKDITYRYSPGYGDFKLDIQEDFLKTLDAQRNIGLTVSSHNILIPRKSVTTIIGVVSKEIKMEKVSCNKCNKYNECSFRRVGEDCGS